MVQARSDGDLDGDGWGRIRQTDVSILEMKLIGLACLLCACMHAESLQSCPTLQPYGQGPSRLLCQWDSPGKKTGVGCHFFLQGVFPAQGFNLCLLLLLH